MNRFQKELERVTGIEAEYQESTSGFMHKVNEILGIPYSEMQSLKRHGTEFEIWDLEAGVLMYKMKVGEQEPAPWRAKDVDSAIGFASMMGMSVNKTLNWHVWDYLAEKEYTLVPKQVRENIYRLLIDEVGEPTKADFKPDQTIVIALPGQFPGNFNL